MRDRLVAAGSVVVLLLSASTLVGAVQVRLRVPGPVVPPTAVDGRGPTAHLPSAAGTRGSGTAAESAGEPRVRRPASAEPVATEAASEEPRRSHWRAVLATLDRRRARAYAADDPERLVGVYVPGSAGLRRDRAVLERYARRGLRVVGLRMLLTAVTAQRVAPGLVALRVREQLAGGVLVGAGVRRRLPPDDPDSRFVVLRRVPGEGWRIAAVRGAV